MGNLSKKKYEHLGNVTPHEKKFADLVLSGESQTDAALQVFNVTSIESARSVGSEVANRERVKAYIVSESMKAAERITELGKSAKNESVRLAANQDILNRAEIGAQKNIQAIQINFGSDQDEYA